VAHHLLGVHKERSLPAFVRPSFPTWFERREPLGEGHRGPVFLFHDTFMDYDAPEIGVSATELLELAGYRVMLSDNVCCGRPMISKGYLGKATEHARTNVERLHEQLGDTGYLVGCEPSCLLTLREEYPRMLAGSDLGEKAREVAGRCLLIDEFLVEDQETNGEPDLKFGAEDGNKVLFHGHCQQKAEADARLSLELLRRAGYDAEMVIATEEEQLLIDDAHLVSIDLSRPEWSADQLIAKGPFDAVIPVDDGGVMIGAVTAAATGSHRSTPT